MKTVFFDVDTQLDFVYPAGALAVPGAENIVESLTELTRFAASNHIQIISTMDAHSEDDPEFKSWKPHCVVGTAGQQKVAATLLNQPLVISSRPGAIEAVRDHISGSTQIIIEKQHIDCFTNPNLIPLLDALGTEQYVVYGVVMEVCVQRAASGLLKRGRAQVQLVTDAVKSLKASDEKQFLEQFRAEGGLAVKCNEVLAGR